MMLLLAVGCLPHGAVGRPVEAAVEYTLVSDAGELPVTRQFVRTFPDGSAGWLVCVGAEPAAHCLELRSFDSGELLVLRGLLAWPEELRARTLGLWPVLSPRLDDDAQFVNGWPVGRVGRDSLRLVGRGGWTRAGARWSWAPALSLTGPGVSQVRGRYTAEVELARGELAAGGWALDGEVCTAPGACRPLRGEGRLRRVGPVPVRAVAPCPQAGESAVRAPLCVAGGPPLEDPSGPGVAVGL